jgi:two-component system alkaline phosphatase synthesis response regulator PhoP
VSARVLIVEDEPTLVLTLTDRLRAEGYEVAAAETGEEGLRLAHDGSFDIILLDVALPGKGGFDVLRDLRQLRVETPVVMLTARGQVVDRVLGLELGRDLVQTLRHDGAPRPDRGRAPEAPGAPAPVSGTFSFGDVRVDFRRAEVLRGGVPVDLSSLEFKLLRYFVEHRGALVGRRELLEQVWGYPGVLQTRTVDVHVASLRQKLEVHPAKPEHIVTVHRMGYRFVG